MQAGRLEQTRQMSRIRLTDKNHMPRRTSVRCRVLAPVVALVAVLLGGCLGGNGTTTAAPPPTPTANVTTITVDGGPAAAAGQINHAYVSVKVCAAGSTGSCATIDHVLLDTGSTGLRLVRSVLAAQ